MGEAGNPVEMTFSCNYGLGRSRTVAKALESAGVRAAYFTGGTKELVQLTPAEIKDRIPKGTKFYLIYDQGMQDPTEYDNKERAIEKLNKAGIKYQLVDSAQLAIICRNHHVDIDDFTGIR